MTTIVDLATKFLTLTGVLFTVAFLTFLAFWLSRTSKLGAPIFQLAAGASLFAGFYFHSIIPTSIGLAFSFLLFGYAFVCCFFVYKTLLREEEEEE